MQLLLEVKQVKYPDLAEADQILRYDGQVLASATYVIGTAEMLVVVYFAFGKGDEFIALPMSLLPTELFCGTGNMDTFL